MSLPPVILSTTLKGMLYLFAHRRRTSHGHHIDCTAHKLCSHLTKDRSMRKWPNDIEITRELLHTVFGNCNISTEIGTEIGTGIGTGTWCRLHKGARQSTQLKNLIIPQTQTSPSPCASWHTCAGNPLASASTTMAPHKGATSEGFTITQLPAISAGSAKSKISSAGKFQGASTTTTPTALKPQVCRRLGACVSEKVGTELVQGGKHWERTKLVTDDGGVEHVAAEELYRPSRR